MLNPLSIGDQIVTGEYKLHSSFEKVINFESNLLISIVTKEIGAGPYNIVVNEIPNIKQITIDQELLTLNIIYNSSIPSNNIAVLDKNLVIFENELLKYTDSSMLINLLNPNYNYNHLTGFDYGLMHRLITGINEIFQGDLLEGVRQIRGVGIGLTPSGDDFICGLILGANFLSKGKDLDRILQDIFKIAKGTNLISNTALYASRNGRVNAIMKDFFYALTSDDELISDKLKKLSLIGHSSGIDTAVGILMSLKRKDIWLSKEL